MLPLLLVKKNKRVISKLTENFLHMMYEIFPRKASWQCKRIDPSGIQFRIVAKRSLNPQVVMRLVFVAFVPNNIALTLCLSSNFHVDYVQGVSSAPQSLWRS